MKRHVNSSPGPPSLRVSACPASPQRFVLPPHHLAARGGFEKGRVIMSVPAPNRPLTAHCSKNKLTAPWPPRLSVHFFYPSLFLSHYIQATWASLLFLKQSQVRPAPGPLHFRWLLPSTQLTKLTACRPSLFLAFSFHLQHSCCFPDLPVSVGPPHPHYPESLPLFFRGLISCL